MTDQPAFLHVVHPVAPTLDCRVMRTHEVWRRAPWKELLSYLFSRQDAGKVWKLVSPRAWFVMRIKVQFRGGEWCYMNDVPLREDVIVSTLPDVQVCTWKLSQHPWCDVLGNSDHVQNIAPPSVQLLAHDRPGTITPEHKPIRQPQTGASWSIWDFQPGHGWWHDLPHNAPRLNLVSGCWLELF